MLGHLVSIRQATSEDAPSAGDLLLATMGVSGEVVFGNGDRRRAADRMAGMFALTGHRMSHQWAHLAVVDGQVSGLLLSFPGARLNALSLHMLAPMLRVFGIAGVTGVALRGLPLLIGKEAQSDEYYVAHIAIAPESQRQGIARALLATAEHLAAEHALRKVALIVDRENHPARALYDRVGYRVERVVRQPDVPPRYHFTGYERRVKDLQ